MIWFFFIFAFIWILITVLMDLFRDHSLSGVAKAIWIIVLVFLPLIGCLVYLIARGGGMQERAMKQAEAQQKAMNEYIRQTAGGVQRRRGRPDREGPQAAGVRRHHARRSSTL